eukprot:COSAG03_NODE_646_length_6508_cov_43.951318_3_plen_46_part_00
MVGGGGAGSAAASGPRACVRRAPEQVLALLSTKVEKEVAWGRGGG